MVLIQKGDDNLLGTFSSDKEHTPWFAFTLEDIFYGYFA
jgi:hypothetical protein